MRLATITLLCALLGAALPAGAASPLTVGHAWARATPPGTSVGAVYLVIDNSGGPADRLLSVTSPVAADVQVHVTEHAGGVMSMRRVDPLDIAAGERLVFRPAGMHVMLIGLKGALVAGGHVPLTLRFEHRGEVQVDAEVVAVDATGPAAEHQH